MTSEDHNRKTTTETLLIDHCTILGSAPWGVHMVRKLMASLGTPAGKRGAQ